MTEVTVTLEREPHAEPEQPEPDSDQVTPLLWESFCRVAAKPADWETWTELEDGLTETEIGAGGAVMVMVAEADFVESATEVAVRVMVAGEGTEAGAV